jgi:hypothetical protein
VEKKDGLQEIKTGPARWLVEGVAALGRWRGIRHLEAVVESPVLRPDGMVLDRPGYDRTTALLYRPTGTFPPLPGAPTRADAVRACAELLEVVCDFPLATPHDRAGYLSMILTPLARHAFPGPAPLHDVSANVRGAGKGLLTDTASIIVSGREFARASYTSDSEEMAKTITALALAGETLAGATFGQERAAPRALAGDLVRDRQQHRLQGRHRTARVAHSAGVH